MNSFPQIYFTLVCMYTAVFTSCASPIVLVPMRTLTVLGCTIRYPNLDSLPFNISNPSVAKESSLQVLHSKLEMDPTGVPVASRLLNAQFGDLEP